MLPCTGVILAGGLSSRFSGKDKSLFLFNEKRIIDHIIERFRKTFEKIILVTNKPIKFIDLDLLIVTDLFQARSSLTGIFSGLFNITTPFAFFTACDTPFIKPELIKAIIEQIDPGIDIVIPKTSAGREPLFAVYSKRCLKHIENQLIQGNYKIQYFFDKVKIKEISEQFLRGIDSDMTSFFNINTQDDLIRAKNFKF